MGNVDGGLVGAMLGESREGTDRTGQRCSTYALAEQLLRHLYGDGSRGEVRLSVVLDDCAWARYRAEVQRPSQPRPSVVVVPVPGVGAMEFRRAGPLARHLVVSVHPRTWADIARAAEQTPGEELVVPVTQAEFELLAADLDPRPSPIAMDMGEIVRVLDGWNIRVQRVA